MVAACRVACIRLFLEPRANEHSKAKELIKVRNRCRGRISFCFLSADAMADRLGSTAFGRAKVRFDCPCPLMASRPHLRTLNMAPKHTSA
jgi:hypothetical protein